MRLFQQNVIPILISFFIIGNQISQDTSFVAVAIDTNQNLAQIKQAGFRDPNTNYLYLVTAYNVTQITSDIRHRSVLKVTKIRLSDSLQPLSQPETVQTLNFHPHLVDFDIHCLPTHCYLVLVTSRTKRNVHLFTWQRVQFDELAVRDSFARPTGVRLFRIQASFYIAIAQEQLHLLPNRLNQDYEEPTRFIGCAILKFSRGQEHNIKYHQFIKLPFNPLFVNYFISASNQNYSTSQASIRLKDSHYIRFSAHQEIDPELGPSLSFIWSPLNDYFWPFRLPRGAQIAPLPGSLLQVLNYPDQYQHQLNQSQPQLFSSSNIDPVESCFHQLQRLLTDREIKARRLVDSSPSLWRSPMQQDAYLQTLGPTNISAQVIVRGNVVVQGSLIQSPQITLLARVPTTDIRFISNLVDTHSPAIVDNKLAQAFYKLNYIRDKLSKAISVNTPIFDGLNGFFQFNGRIRFFGNILANRVIFKNGGISNSNVKLNGIPFKQLATELISLRGSQDILAKVSFMGNVVADFLEVHGTVNGVYLMKDAVDITTSLVQVIDISSSNPLAPGLIALDFRSVATPEVILSPDTTLNTIRLDELITINNQTQIITGRKSFKQLSMGRLNLADSDVALNGYNLTRVALDSLKLSPSNQARVFNGNHVTFTQTVTVDKLVIKGFVNSHINLTAFVQESVKSIDPNVQQVFGHKHFQRGLKINRLTTDGLINGIQINQVFNLNPTPPTSDFNRSSYQPFRSPINGHFSFAGFAAINGNLNAGLINGINITHRAIRRQNPALAPFSGNISNFVPPQIIRGRKTFTRPLRVLNRVGLIEQPQMDIYGLASSAGPPLVNGLNVGNINIGIAKQMLNPAVINVENFEVEGNLIINASQNRTGSGRVTLGTYLSCPLDFIHKRLVLGGSEDQIVEVPLKVGSLKAKAIQLLSPGGLNGMNFPEDFVLKFPPTRGDVNLDLPSQVAFVQTVFGHKTFESLHVVPSLAMPVHLNSTHSPGPHSQFRNFRPQRNVNLIVGPNTVINDITYNELQTFILQESQRNSSGETVLQTLDVHGRLYSRLINGNSWPEDILLKSTSSIPGPPISPYLHRRIYSPIVFLKPNHLNVEDILNLKGPIQLNGRLNGANLTDFARQSVTYGDKDLLSISKPIRNKVFMGGLTVNGEMRAQGRIEGISIDEMRNRVVTIGPNMRKTVVVSPKFFMSDVHFAGPIDMVYLNNLPLYQFLKRMQNQQDSKNIRIFGKKTVSGTLKIDRNLFVEGLINGINFIDLQARSISLAPTNNPIQFNQTLTIDGDVFLDNLLIDEKNGIIDGVKLTNLIPIQPINSNELQILQPSLVRLNSSLNNQMNLIGRVQDCQISCSLVPGQRPPVLSLPMPASPTVVQLPVPPPPTPQAQIVAYPPRPIMHLGRNVSYMRTTPPYTIIAPTGPLPTPSPRNLQFVQPQTLAPAQSVSLPPLQKLVAQRPISINYEHGPQGALLINGNERQAAILNQQQLDFIRNEIVSLHLMNPDRNRQILIGFIPSLTNDITPLQLPERNIYEPVYYQGSEHFRQLDGTEFLFRPMTLHSTVYHLAVGTTTNNQGRNLTAVYFQIGGNHWQQLSVLPVEAPKSAMFLESKIKNALLLIVSEDQTTLPGFHCPRYKDFKSSGIIDFNYLTSQTQQLIGGVHVYLFHSLQNSSSLTSPYFDLYQTIDLSAIDGFDTFDYLGSTYVLAISRSTSKVYLLILRGYLGFEEVSYFDAPMLESVKIFYTRDGKPSLLLFLTNGQHKLMDSVVI